MVQICERREQVKRVTEKVEVESEGVSSGK